ncbi:MAG: T9SS type A sorting domain-containing protein [Aureispira sp.]|nr:T9SS type A sorting domain-containing protein [Aureispira sp.]
MTINISNSLGQQVQTQQLNAISGNQQVQLDLSKLSPNMYFVELNDGQNSVAKKIIVQ